MSDQRVATGEGTELLDALGGARHFLRHTLRDLSDEQAARRTTVSELSLGGLLKHVSMVEHQWTSFIEKGPSAMSWDSSAGGDWTSGFRMLDGDTVNGLLDRYDQVARRTHEVVSRLPDLDADHPLPEEPWFERGARWSARRVLLHLIAETAQHAGHADIIRESLDGGKSMG